MNDEIFLLSFQKTKGTLNLRGRVRYARVQPLAMDTGFVCVEYTQHTKADSTHTERE